MDLFIWKMMNFWLRSNVFNILWNISLKSLFWCSWKLTCSGSVEVKSVAAIVKIAPNDYGYDWSNSMRCDSKWLKNAMKKSIQKKRRKLMYWNFLCCLRSVIFGDWKRCKKQLILGQNAVHSQEHVIASPCTGKVQWTRSR